MVSVRAQKVCTSIWPFPRRKERLRVGRNAKDRQRVRILKLRFLKEQLSDLTHKHNPGHKKWRYSKIHLIWAILVTSVLWKISMLTVNLDIFAPQFQSYSVWLWDMTMFTLSSMNTVVLCDSLISTQSCSDVNILLHKTCVFLRSICWDATGKGKKLNENWNHCCSTPSKKRCI